MEKSKRIISTCLFSREHLAGDTMECCYKLSLEASAFPESVLIVTEDTIGMKMVHDATVYDLFQDLAYSDALKNVGNEEEEIE